MFEGLFQPMHLLVIFGIALLVFGPKKLPELGKGIGEGIRGFKSAMKSKPKNPPPYLPATRVRPKGEVVGFGTELLLMLLLGFLLLGPKQMHALLRQVGRAKAQLDQV